MAFLWTFPHFVVMFGHFWHAQNVHCYLLFAIIKANSIAIELHLCVDQETKI